MKIKDFIWEAGQKLHISESLPQNADSFISLFAPGSIVQSVEHVWLQIQGPHHENIPI